MVDTLGFSASRLYTESQLLCRCTPARHLFRDFGIYLSVIFGEDRVLEESSDIGAEFFDAVSLQHIEHASVRIKNFARL
jgi:hypothetical protein